ncbi:MAG: hypothetical protein KF855_01445 [Acidobacteria bacterium]|nr:hypothetical protein [Acidobacteriota bacterium]
MTFAIESTNPVVRSLIEGAAPEPARVAASRGILPLPQNDLFEVLVAFAASTNAELAENAREALSELDEETLLAAARSNDVPVAFLNYFAGRPKAPAKLHEAIILNARTPAATVIAFSRNTDNGSLLELIATNQQMMIQNPAIIEAIIANPHRTPEAERRAAETKREFFEKERGSEQIVGELRAQGKEAAAEFIEQLDTASSGLSDDDALLIASMIEVPDSETDDAWLGLEYLEELYEETDEQRQHVINKIVGDLQVDGDEITNERISVINRVMKMGMKDRVRLAMKGDREARNILIRDPNRVVAQAVVNNPRITEQEVEKIAAMRSIPEDVLRIVANNRQWARSYAIVHNLARNPRTPIGSVMTILNRLQLRDLKTISENKNVSDAVRRQALRLFQARKGR